MTGDDTSLFLACSDWSEAVLPNQVEIMIARAVHFLSPFFAIGATHRNSDEASAPHAGGNAAPVRAAGLVIRYQVPPEPAVRPDFTMLDVMCGFSGLQGLDWQSWDALYSMSLLCFEG